MKQDKIINLTEFRLSRQAQNNEQKIKINAFEKIEENKQSDSAKFNYEFYCLVDLFCAKHTRIMLGGLIYGWKK